jgi:hypothetical protein
LWGLCPRKSISRVCVCIFVFLCFASALDWNDTGHVTVADLAARNGAVRYLNANSVNRVVAIQSGRETNLCDAEKVSVAN